MYKGKRKFQTVYVDTKNGIEFSTSLSKPLLYVIKIIIIIIIIIMIIIIIIIMILIMIITRTHLMARHRKSPRSQRNLMVIDPLTPSQGHQFDRRLKLFSVSWSTAHPLLFDMPHDHVQKINFLAPTQGPRGRGHKKLCWCMCHSCE